MTRVMRSRWVVASAAAAVGCCSVSARAADKFWGSFTSGDFLDPNRWFVGQVPLFVDRAVYRVFGGTPQPYTVTFEGYSNPILVRDYAHFGVRVGPNDVTFANLNDGVHGPVRYTLNSAVEIGEGTGASVLNTGLDLITPTFTVGLLAGSPATLNIIDRSVTVTGSGTSTGMVVGGSGIGTVNLNAGPLNLTGSGGDFELIVGQNAPGTINVKAGMQMNFTAAGGNAALGFKPGVSGTVNVTGAGAVWNNAGDTSAPLSVGYGGAGALNVTAGGQVNNHTGYVATLDGSTGSALVSGAGSGWTNRGTLIVGVNGAGLLTVSNGGQVTCEEGTLGSGETASGTVNVSGVGSFWGQNTDLTVGGAGGTINGGAGVGALSVAAAARVVTGRDAYIGVSGAGSVSVTGAGSSWTVGGQLGVNRAGIVNLSAGGTASANTAIVAGRMNVANAGTALKVADWMSVSTNAFGSTSTAAVSVTNGARVENRVAYVGGGLFGGGLGAIFLDGAGSNWTSTEQLFVGFLGGGDVTVARGAQIVSGEGQLGVSPNSLGTVTVDGAGSRWDNAGYLWVGVGGSARATVSAGGVIASGGPLMIGPRGLVEGKSTVVANVRNAGIVAPGVSTNIIANDFLGTLSITGNYTQAPGGRFAVEIGSTTLHDRLNVTGTAAIDGSLSTTLVNGFVPTPGDRFTILSAAQRTGTFQPTASLGGSVFLVPLYTPTEVILMATAAGTKTWGVDAGGDSSVGSNWFGGAPVNGAGGVDGRVAFTTVISANRTVNVDAPFTTGFITFDDDNDYAVQGPGAIRMQVSSGNAVITAANAHGGGRHTIAAPLHLASRTGFDVQDPAGLLTVTQQMTADPGVLVGKIGAGTLELKNVRADGLFVNVGTLRIARDGGQGGTSKVNQLVMMAGARLDLDDNDLVVSYAATGASPYAAIRNLVIAGLVNNTGIVSTAGQAAGNTVHAVVESARIGATSWNGLGIDDDESVIVAYALRGDANVDGTVDFLDLVAVAQNYNNATGLAYWDMGDFTYDGNVDFNDLVAVAQNYNASMPSGPVPGAPAGFAGELAAAFAAVPEPSLVGGLCLVGYGLTARRRRRARSA